MTCSDVTRSKRQAETADARLVITGALVILAGCSKPESLPPPPTAVSVQISAASDANPTPQGEGAPVAIRVYQLGGKSGFEGAEFFQIYHADAATLGPDLIKKDEFLLIPGASKVLDLMPDAPVQAVGVFAAYSDFQKATWRATADIPSHQSTKITITAGRDGLKLDATSTKPASP
jgi:type VI secretion system protein VasD